MFFFFPFQNLLSLTVVPAAYVSVAFLETVPLRGLLTLASLQATALMALMLPTTMQRKAGHAEPVRTTSALFRGLRAAPEKKRQWT
ncbi:hypothetical protein [Algiphilus aromaticivorans]|jgi:hypothetical protein|uniref:hypothetical protein n=1 Tax=Algiphilus aromaticivorans TaxID=382454 RepID=UPI0009FE875F|nr:hypothetical protein [Algiphilus aromaticivorans]